MGHKENIMPAKTTTKTELFTGDEVRAIVDMLIDDLRARGGFSDIWHEMLPEQQAELKAKWQRFIKQQAKTIRGSHARPQTLAA